MKKIFSKFEVKNEKLESNTSKVNFTGKVFNVGKIKIEVEDTISEGMILIFYMYIFIKLNIILKNRLFACLYC